MRSRKPISAPPLAELARGRRSACILVCDITRPVPNRLFLRPMIETMAAAGIPLDRIDMLVATGLHRPNEGAELAELIGDPWVHANVRVTNHVARNATKITSTRHDADARARRSRSTAVFMDADLRIATGLVEPHFMAGWSGGRKVVAPGVAGHETIRTFHSARFMEDPLAVQCNLVGNPLHEEQLEIVRRIGEIYALNTVIDEDRDLVFVIFGEIIASHLAAVAYIAGSTAVKLPRRFKTVVTSSAGYPLDKTYYQTVKGMVTPIDILAPGGTLIVASACSEGFGSPEFRAAQTAAGRARPGTISGHAHGEVARRHRRVADRDAAQGDAGRAACSSTPRASMPKSAALTGVEMIGSVDDRRSPKASRGMATPPSRSSRKVPTSSPITGRADNARGPFRLAVGRIALPRANRRRPPLGPVDPKRWV